VPRRRVTIAETVLGAEVPEALSANNRTDQFASQFARLEPQWKKTDQPVRTAKKRRINWKRRLMHYFGGGGPKMEESF
jgi:hypothetical protein